MARDESERLVDRAWPYRCPDCGKVGKTREVCRKGHSPRMMRPTRNVRREGFGQGFGR